MVLVDGNACPKWERPSTAIVGGDAICRSIAAASIVAKVDPRQDHGRLCARASRLRLGVEQGLCRRPSIRARWRELGPAVLHRRSFAPVRQLIAGASARAIVLDGSCGQLEFLSGHTHHG